MIKKMLFILSLFLMLLAIQMTEGHKESRLNLTHVKTELTKTDLDQRHDAGIFFSGRTLSVSERSEQSIKGTTRLLELFLQKEQKVLNKTSEVLLTTNSLKFSSLRIRSGHWVYVLRKIII